MNTVMITVLGSMLLAGQSATPTWQKSYSQARLQSSAQSKPIAVMFGSSSNGWMNVVKDAAPTEEVTRLLTDKYICCYVDTTSPKGKQLAENFGITADTGMVISDRTGQLQAFWHQGDMSSNDLTSCLTKFSTDRPITTTETNRTVRTSNYPPSAESGSNMYSNPFSSSYCPSCGNARGRR
jgi:hypothetical protein